MTLTELNNLNIDAATEAFNRCCTASRWIDRMVQGRPYASLKLLQENATSTWDAMKPTDFIEAFDGHPKIGDPESLKKKYRVTLETASAEQSGVNSASDQILNQLAEFNTRYEEKFGFIFIVYASGKSAAQMLDILTKRIQNAPDEEIKVAAVEQHKITTNRLNQLIAVDPT